MSEAPFRNHSVILDENECKGCTVCVTTCPAQAIRVRDGKARILEERCIDCGECIRRCPHHAKKARSDEFPQPGTGVFSRFAWRIALPAPSLYGQFPEKYSITAIHRALLSLGFDEVFPVSAATTAISAATRALLDPALHPGLPRPLISSSCPAIIKIIQSRFPSLLDHVTPVIAPMELAGRLARKRALGENEGRSADTQLRENDIGVFFISPCAGKITEARFPPGDGVSSIDAVFSIKDLHLPLLAALSKETKDAAPAVFSPDSAAEIAWGRAGGEAEATIGGLGREALAVDGMEQCVRVLETIENGSLDSVSFIELMACTGGCLGGPLTVIHPAIARHTLVCREQACASPPQPPAEPAEPAEASEPRCGAAPGGDLFRPGPIPARPALLLDSDYQKAMEMLSDIDEIREDLPGLDCGCCGAPNCRSLAEDIVRGNANRTDCVIILKEQYRELLENRTGKHDEI